MPEATTDRFKLIETKEALQDFVLLNSDIDWMCFDTEFVGEKRFYTTICLIQIATRHGCFLIDPIKIKDLQPVIDLLTNENILKIVHAGENDYRLFNTQFGIIPRNTFDTQIAASFAGYKYPVGFSKLVESELGIHVSKGFTVTDWEQRPFDKKQLAYAVADVMHLRQVWQNLSEKLKSLQRLEWAYEEFRVLESPETYESDPYKEALESNLIKGLRKKEQLFLLRLFLWRAEEARKKNYSKEMILPGKLIGPIARVIHSGSDALRNNRRLPESIVQRYGEVFIKMFQQPATEIELNVLRQIPPDHVENEKQDILMEMLDLLVRYRCLQAGIPSNVAMPRSALRRMKNDKDYFESCLESGWRREFLGEEIINWFRNRQDLGIEFVNGKFELKMQR
ncbi:MAG: hypothetical protein RI973_2097 [Bacteroidota bacterium]|jgi:ribonuclease D